MIIKLIKIDQNLKIINVDNSQNLPNEKNATQNILRISNFQPLRL